MVQKSPARGRPRSFDPDRVLTDVRNTFGRHGYAGTSMDQLALATGLHKPSLYGAFGDKKQLYFETLSRYLADAREQFGAALSRPRLVDCLTEVSERAIDLFTRNGPNGCFMMSTAMPEAGGDAEISRVVREAMDSLDRALVHRFQLAIDAGELSADADCEGLARIVVASHYDLSARARAGYSKEELRALASRSLDLVRKLGGLEDSLA